MKIGVEGRRARSDPRSSLRILWSIVCLFAILIPLFFSGSGEDGFRLPKELLLRLEAILLVAGMAIVLIRGSIRHSDWAFDAVVAIAIAATSTVAVITTLLSTNRRLSLDALGYFVCYVVVFAAAYLGAGKAKFFSTVAVGLAAALPNALLAILQRSDWWNPFSFPPHLEHRLRTIGLIGNANDLGAFLAVCAVAAAAYVATRPRSGMGWIVLALTVGGLIASDTLTAFLSFLASTTALICLKFPRRSILAIAILAAVAMIAVLIVPPLRDRAVTIAESIQSRDYERLSSHRVVSFAAALLMARDRPLIGLGPGTFKWHYLPYRLRVEQSHPELYLKYAVNFREVHSDHLQILAEEGVFGYLVFIGNIGLLAAASKRRSTLHTPPDDPRQKFVRYAGLPLATAIFVLALAGFPLELAAVMTPAVFFAAVVVRWRRLERHA
jgi:O-antigen ligase